MTEVRPLFGVETEYAVTAVTRSGQPAPRDPLLARFIDLARKQLAFLPDEGGNGLFLQNGSRLYVDSGSHPELATPECTHPWDVVRFVRAGDKLMAGLADQLAAAVAGLREVVLFRCNVDYGGTGATWGCHESYLYRSDPALLPDQLIPHLVSRTIYTGAGGFDPSSPGIEFTLSPRAAYLPHVVSRDSTSNRGIFHTKDEPLAGGGYHRLHVICGESLCSERATLLKVGVTALVVAMVDAGLRPGDAVKLAAPVEALRAFAADPRCKAQALLVGGRRVSALDIQRHYLEQAENCSAGGGLPAWAASICRLWRATLQLLEGAPRSVARTLDWAIKHALYEHWCRSGPRWETLVQWTPILTRLRAALARTEYRDRTVTVDFLLSEASPVAKEVRQLTPLLRERRLSWSDLQPFLSLRHQLLEVDTRFGQLGDRGVFAQLDRSGDLSHRILDPAQVERALFQPPDTGRARLRGEWVQRLQSDRDGRYWCGWTGIRDDVELRQLDLSDPFTSEVEWRDWSPENDRSFDQGWTGTGVP
jgi:proteasome accessory factor A